MYATISRLDNKDATRLSLSSGSTVGQINQAPTAAGNSKGFQLGVRHFF